MTPMEAWHIISANMMQLYKIRRANNPNFKGYTDAELEAEVICFKALGLMEQQEKQNEKQIID